MARLLISRHDQPTVHPPLSSPFPDIFSSVNRGCCNLCAPPPPSATLSGEPSDDQRRSPERSSMSVGPSSTPSSGKWSGTGTLRPAYPKTNCLRRYPTSLSQGSLLANPPWVTGARIRNTLQHYDATDPIGTALPRTGRYHLIRRALPHRSRSLLRRRNALGKKEEGQTQLTVSRT
jgi:hypothetical protein